MKRLFLTLCACAIVATAEAFQLPSDRDDTPAFNVQDVGVYVFLSTSEVPWLLSGGSRTLAGGSIFGSGDPGYGGGSSIAIYGVLTSTFSGAGDSPAYVLLRATNTANTTSELLVPPIAIGISTSVTQTVHFAKNNFVIFDPPIVAPDQVSVNLSSALGALTTYRYSAAIFYRYLATNVPEDVWFPTSDMEGRKTVGGASLYGVRTGSVTAGGLVNDGIGAEFLDFTQAPRVVQTSTQPAEQSPQFLYGWSASSGALGSWFEVNDATGVGDYFVSSAPAVFTSSFTFLPKIYPRTFGPGWNNYPWGTVVPPSSLNMNFEFNFPWPLIARRGLRFTAGQATERFRMKSRNRRALR